jgi:hypothetical protein
MRKGPYLVGPWAEDLHLETIRLITHTIERHRSSESWGGAVCLCAFCVLCFCVLLCGGCVSVSLCTFSHSLCVQYYLFLHCRLSECLCDALGHTLLHATLTRQTLDTHRSIHIQPID